MRNLTEDDREFLAKLKAVAAREERVVAEAEAKIRATIEATVTAARRETNRLVYEAVQKRRITKANVARESFPEIESRNHIYARIEEHRATFGGFDSVHVAGGPDAGPVRVEHHDDGISVHMTDYMLGDDLLNGVVVFDKDGEATDATENLRDQFTNPLTMASLYNSAEVQAAL